MKTFLLATLLLALLPASAQESPDAAVVSKGMSLKFAAVPVVFAALFGISPETSDGSCACGSVPVVRLLALFVMGGSRFIRKL